MPKDLAALLLEAGAVPADAVARALDRQREAGGALDTALLEEGVLSEEALVAWLASAAELPAAPPEAWDASDGRARRVFPSRVAERHGLAPFALHGRELALVATYPVDLGLLDEISFMLSLHLAPHVGPEWRVRELIHRLYGGALSPRLAALAAAAGRPVTPAPGPGAAAQATAEAPAPPAAGFAESGEELEPLAAALQLALDAADAGPPEAPPPASAAAEEATADEEEPPVPEPGPDLPPPDRTAPPHWTLDEARAALATARDRDEIVLVALRYARDFLEYAAMFAVTRDAVAGHDALGREDERDRARTVAIWASDPGIFKTVIETRSPYLGPVARDAAGTETILSGLGRGAPRTVLVHPVLLQDRTVCVLYADNGEAPVSPRRLGDLLLFLSGLGAAFERIIRRRKKQRRRSEGAAPVAEAPPTPEPRTEPERAPEPEAGQQCEAVAEPQAQLAEPLLVPGPEPEPEQQPEPLADPEPVRRAATEGEVAGPEAPTPSPSSPTEAEPEPPQRAAEPLDDAGGQGLAPSAPSPAPRDAPAEASRGDEAESAMEAALASIDVDVDVEAGEERGEEPSLPTGPPSTTPSPPAASPPIPPAASSLDALEDAFFSGAGQHEPPPRPPPPERPPPSMPERPAAAPEPLRGAAAEPLATVPEPLRGAAAEPLAAATEPPRHADPEPLPAAPEPPRRADPEPLPAAPEPARRADPEPLPGAPSPTPAALRTPAPVPPPSPAALADRALEPDEGAAFAAREALAAQRREPGIRPANEKLRRALLSGISGRTARAARAIGAIRDVEAIPLLIQVLETSEPETANAAADALALITLQRLGPDARKWLGWWKENRGRGRAEWLFSGLTSPDRETRLAAVAELSLAAPPPVEYSADLPPAERERLARAWAGWWTRSGHVL